MQDALGVVKPVDAQQQRVRLAEGQPDIRGPLPDLVAPGDSLQGRRVDRDREGRRLDLALAVGVAGPDGLAVGLQVRGPAAGAQEVRRVGPALETHQVRAEQALDHLAAPGKLGEDLVAGKRNVVEEADAKVGAPLAQHLRHQLQLVVMYPDRRARRRRGRRRGGERPVDDQVGLPPSAVELRRGDDVVVQRPQGRVAETLVVIPHLLRGQPHPNQVQAVGFERPRSGPRVTGPADPHAVGLPHDRLKRRDQPARTGSPAILAIRPVDPVHRQPAGHHHEVVPPRTGRVTHRRPGSIRGRLPGAGMGGAKQAGERTPVVVFGSGAGPEGPSVNGLKADAP